MGMDQKVMKNLKSLKKGDRLRLRDETLKHVKTRDWLFDSVESKTEIVLMHQYQMYGLIVQIDDIDWEHQTLPFTY
jgi:hypothetical protein